MRSEFKDPIKAKEGKKLKSPWDFRMPPYDERSSAYINAGTNYGVGHKNPVGSEGKPKMRVSTMPFGRVTTMKTDEVAKQRMNPEFIED